MEVLAINPTKKKKGGKKSATKKGQTMAEKKKKKATTKKRKTNPSAKSVAKKTARRAKQTIGGMNIGAAFRGTVPRLAGMMAAQWGAKRFSDGGGANDPNWEFKNYLIGAASGFGAGMIAENIKKGSGQKVLEGTMAFLAYKALVNEVAPQNEWLMEQFGEDDEFVMMGEDDEYEAVFGADDEYEAVFGADDEYEAVFGADDEYTEGDAYLADDGETYVMGADRRWYPVSESHRQISDDDIELLGDELQRPGRLGGELQRPGRLGGELQRPGRLGEMAVFPPSRARQNDPYMVAYAGRG